MHSFCSIIKTVYEPSAQGTVPLRFENRTIIFKNSSTINTVEGTTVKSCWTDSLMPKTIPVKPFHNTALKKEYLADPPTLQETLKANKEMESNKACGFDGIPAEIYKQVAKQLFQIILQQWWWYCTPAYKLGRSSTHILLNKLTFHTEEILFEYQCDFRPLSR